MQGINPGTMIGMALAGAVALASTGAAAARVDGPQVTWNFAVWGQKRAATFGPEELARRLDAATDGKFKLVIHYGGTLAPEKELLDGITIGAYEMTLGIPGFIPGKLPVCEGIGLPFLPQPTTRHTRAVRDAFFAHPSPQADLGRWDANFIMSLPIGANEFVGKGKPPLTLADWKGLRVRALSGDARAMQLLGASPHSTPTQEIYGGLERGLLDAASAAPYALAVFRNHEVSDWFTSNAALSASAAFVIGSVKATGALPHQYRQLLFEEVKPSTDAWVDVIAADDIKAFETFRARGLREIRYAPADLEQLAQAAKPMWDEWVADVTRRGHPGQELLDLILRVARSVPAG